MDFLQPIFEAYPIVKTILVILGSIVLVAQTFVAMKPESSFADVYEDIEGSSIGKKILEFLESFAPFKKKKGGGMRLNNKKENE